MKKRTERIRMRTLSGTILAAVAFAAASVSVVAEEKWSMFERRLGMFVHWGIYSVGEWHEQEQQGCGVEGDMTADRKSVV